MNSHQLIRQRRQSTNRLMDALRQGRHIVILLANNDSEMRAASQHRLLVKPHEMTAIERQEGTTPRNSKSKHLGIRYALICLPGLLSGQYVMAYVP